MPWSIAPVCYMNDGRRTRKAFSGLQITDWQINYDSWTDHELFMHHNINGYLVYVVINNNDVKHFNNNKNNDNSTNNNNTYVFKAFRTQDTRANLERIWGEGVNPSI